MFKKWALPAILFLGIIFFCRHFLINEALQIYLISHSKQMGAPLSFESSAHSENSLIFYKPNIQIEGGKIEADKLVIKYELHPIERRLDLSVDFQNLSCFVPNKEANLQAILNSWFDKSLLLNVSGQINCAEGFLHLKDPESRSAISFSLNHSWGKKNEGLYSFVFGEADEKGSLQLSFNAEDQSNFSLKAKAEEVNAKKLSEALKTIVPGSFKWNFQEGMLDGELAFTIADAKLQDGYGNFNIVGLKAEEGELGILACIEEAVLNIDAKSQNATFKLTKGCSLALKDEEIYAEFKDFKGIVSVENSNLLKVDLKGFWDDHENPMETELHGHTAFSDLSALFFKILLTPLKEPKHLSYITVQAKKTGEEGSAEVLLHRFGPKQFHFWQRALENLFPGVNPISYHNGNLNALLNISFSQKGVKALSIKNIEAENAFVVVKPWEMALGVDKLNGVLSINLDAPNPKDTLNADLKIQNGGLSLIGANFDFWNFTNIETDLMIKQGVFQKSSASVELAGLKGSAEIDFLNDPEIIRLHLEGKAADLKSFLPERIQLGIDKNLSEHELFVEASISKKPQRFAVYGDILVKNRENQISLPLSFGFDLEKSLLDIDSPAISAYWRLIAPFYAEKMVPPALKTLATLESRWMLQELGIQGFVMSNGWFKAQSLPLEKYLSPFLFVEDQMILKGVSNLKGTFDPQGVSIQYDAKNASLENGHLIIEVKEIFSQDETELPGSHYIDFTKGKHFGKLPIRKGSYFDKNHGLLFTELNADVLFEGEKVHMLDVETFSNGLLLAGHIDIDYSDPLKGAFDLDIYVDALHGKFSEAQHFFSHFDQSLLFLNIPLDGEINSREAGGHLCLNFKPDHFDLNCKFAGSLSEGNYESSNLSLRILDLSLNFDFDSESNHLAFTDIQGALLVGELAQADEYRISGEKIYFKDFKKGQAEFDLWVGDRNRDLIRIAGKTASDEKDERKVVFSFDESLTHFGDIHPHEIALTLLDWTRVESAKLDFNFRLSSLIYDLQKLSRSGAFFFSDKLLMEIDSITHAGGEFSVTLQYEGASDNFLFNVAGHDLTFDRHQFKNFALSGKQRGKTWSIDELKLDEISAAAELTKEEDLWKANFLGLRYGQSLLMGLSGEYKEGSEQILGQVNLLELHLPMIKEWPELAFLQQYNLQGGVRAKGQFNLTPPKKGQKWRLEAFLDLGLKACKLDNLILDDLEGINCHFVSGRGITIDNALLSFQGGHKDLNPRLNVHKLDFDFASHCLNLERADFSLAAEDLNALSAHLRGYFPSFVNDDGASLIANLKHSGQVKGSLSLIDEGSNFELGLQLEDGTYEIFGKPYDLKTFSLTLDNEELKIATQQVLNNHLFWISTRSDAGNLDRGAILFSDEAVSEEFAPLFITWRRDDRRGVTIESAEGCFCGMRFNLKENYENPTTQSALHLRGHIAILDESFRNILDPQLASSLMRWEVGKGYLLQGDFEIEKEALNMNRDIRFFGSLTGEDFELKGYRFKHLFSQVVYGPEFVQISDISITDPAGALYIGRADVLKRGGKLELFIPVLNIQEMRPSILTEIGKPPSRYRKPLIIRNLHVENLHGILGEEDSFKGRGNLDFVNPVKKHLQNTIFAIPAEILTRIGLDSSVLTPVTGSIQYEISDGRIHLTKFKDIYSHSKLSRFYLPNTHNSSIDFDGNLNIQVRMKQYTLLFKLAELFTVTIKGNLKKPTYTLQRQKPLHRAEVVSTE